MYVRQCISCLLIDGRETFDDAQSAARVDEWRCEHCGGTVFEAVVMAEDEPTGEVADEFE
ncbi:MAG: hypothetical protein QOE17_1435 [Gaiellales bacterium]|jgi:hypothetical protein|nr:hypothetical protein [Gaiellales bacterium]